MPDSGTRKMYQFSVAVLILVNCVGARPSYEKNAVGSPNDYSSKTVRFCQPQTPCGWTIYNRVNNPAISVANDYCVCRPGTQCDFHVNRVDGGHIEFRCKIITNDNNDNRFKD